MSAVHNHVIHGLEVRSPIELSEAFTGGGGADVSIRIESATAGGAVQPPDYYVEHADSRSVQVRVAGAGVVCAERGSNLFIAPHPASSENRVRSLIYGAGLTLILLQRERLPLHGSGVLVDGRAVIFLGQSGSGKSTFVQALCHRGYPVIGDDLLGVVDIEGALAVYPGVCSLRLAEDSMGAFGYDCHELPPADRASKRWTPVLSYPKVDSAWPVGLMVVLEAGSDIKIERCQPIEAFQHLVRQAILSHAAHAMDRSKVVMRYASRLANEVPVFKVTRTSGYSDMIALTSAIRQLAAGQTESLSVSIG